MKKKIILVSSSLKPFEIFLRELIISLSKYYEITLVTNISHSKSEFLKNFNFINIPITRKINLFDDLLALIKLRIIINEIRPKLIISITPKGGFYSAICNLFLKNKHLHFITGQNWINKNGIKKNFFKFIDKFTFHSTDFLLSDSHSQINYLGKEKFNISKIQLIKYGSICGVDTDIFRPDEMEKKNLRKIYGINDSEVVILFLGRINKEKGVFKLYDVCKKLYQNNYPIKIFYVGEIEDSSFNKIINDDKKDLAILKHFNFTNSPEKFMKISDIFCLPSSREGFGLSIIEASSSGLPVLGSNIIGLKDSIVHNETGILFDIDSGNDFYNNLKKLVISKKIRDTLGLKGRKRVNQYFKKNDVINFIETYIKKILNSNKF